MEAQCVIIIHGEALCVPTAPGMWFLVALAMQAAAPASPDTPFPSSGMKSSFPFLMCSLPTCRRGSGPLRLLLSPRTQHLLCPAQHHPAQGCRQCPMQDPKPSIQSRAGAAFTPNTHFGGHRKLPTKPLLVLMQPQQLPQGICGLLNDLKALGKLKLGAREASCILRSCWLRAPLTHPQTEPAAASSVKEHGPKSISIIHGMSPTLPGCLGRCQPGMEKLTRGIKAWKKPQRTEIRRLWPLERLPLPGSAAAPIQHTKESVYCSLLHLQVLMKPLKSSHRFTC